MNYREAVDFGALERDAGAPSTVEYRGFTGYKRLYPGWHRPQVPLQPTWNPSASRVRYRHVARSAWFHGRELIGSTIANLRAVR